ncbi:MAG: tetratricopeptide repeat protein [Planctomycetota bacterium]
MFPHERELFHRALGVSAGERAAFLLTACDDPELRRRVAALLRAFDDAALPTGGAVISLQAAADLGDLDIPGFTIGGEIGRGGMGRVFAAEQSEPRRKAAIKFLPDAFASAEGRRRFQLEAQVLGRLNHVGIAQIYAAGVVDVGDATLPYFAMELVEGRTLHDFVTAEGLALEARLELIAQVADAVQHAHQQGVIHRDLKPDNVMVTREGQSKVLDFGVSKVIETDAQLSTLRTGIGQVVGTLAYMAPEQASGASAMVDTRADVYALGVMAYQLATGALPIDVHGETITVALARVLDEVPAPASRHDPALRGDVDTILSKALAKEPDQRYASAAAFAEDLRRYLQHHPIAARPLSASYQMAKFVRRNPALTAALGGVALLLVASSIVTAILLARATHAEHAAREERTAAVAARDDTDTVNRFLRNVIMQGAANEAGREGTLREAFDRVLESIDEVFAHRPQSEAAAREAAAVVLGTYGEHALALTHVERAIALRRQQLSSEHRDVLRLRSYRASLLDLMGREADALEELQSVLPLQRLELAPDHEDRRRTAGVLASVVARRGDLTAARQLIEEHLADPLDPDEERPDVLLLRQRLGTILTRLGERDLAEQLHRATLRIRERVSGPSSPTTLTLVNSLGLLLKESGQLEEAAELLERAYKGLQQSVGEDHLQTLAALNNLALVHDERGQYDISQPLLRDVLSRLQEVFGKTHPTTLSCQSNLAASYRDGGSPAAAEPIFRAVLEQQRAALGELDARTLITHSNLAGTLSQLQRFEDAQHHAVLSARGLEEQLGARASSTRRAALIAAEVFERSGDATTAARWRAKAATEGL